MIKALWLRFGHFLVVGILAVVALLAVRERVPESPAVQMDMRKLILYERTLNTDVILVEETDEGVTIVIALWNDDWAGTTVLEDFVVEYDPIILLLDTPVDAIVEVDGEIYYGTVYSAIGMASCINGDCDSGPLSGVLNNPEAVDWDWGRR